MANMTVKFKLRGPAKMILIRIACYYSIRFFKPAPKTLPIAFIGSEIRYLRHCNPNFSIP